MAPPTSRGSASGSDLPNDVVADLLAADRRLYTLDVLAERGSAIALDDLAAEIRAREAGTSPGDVDRSERKRIREELFERHLPKLTATEVVAYDSVLGTVELADEGAVAGAVEGQQDDASVDD